MNDFYCDNVFNGRVEVKKIKETENVLAFHHTKPGWTLHIVIVPKQHIRNLIEADAEVVKEIILVAQDIIKSLGLTEKNYKLIANGGSFQDSQHLHFHLVSGKRDVDSGE